MSFTLLHTRRAVLSVVCGLALGAASPAAAQSPATMDLAVKQMSQSNAPTQDVILTAAPGQLANLVQALQAYGAVVKQQHKSLNAVSTRVHAADVDALATNGLVQQISSDATIATDGPSGQSSNTGSTGSGSGTSTLRSLLGLTNSSPTGAGVRVSVIDSGIA